MMKKTILPYMILSAVAVFAVSCTNDQPKLRKEPNIELIQDMMDQPAIKPQDYLPGQPKVAGSRMPPENTVPVGYKPYPYHNDPVTAAARLKNPFSGDMSPEIVNLGRVKYETYCAVCHGYEGKGDGPVAPKMALKPPPVVSEKVINQNDAAIYHIITDGQGVMASYAPQIHKENDRWAIVNYIRSLQKLSK